MEAMAMYHQNIYNNKNFPMISVINPRRACARVTVLVNPRRACAARVTKLLSY